MLNRANFLLTALGIRKKGFFTPYNYLSTINGAIEPYSDIADLFNRHRGEFSDFLQEIGTNEDRFLASKQGKPAINWDSRFISRLDGASIYTAITRFKPRTVIEIGSGNSTFFLCRAIADFGLQTRVHCIDPAPRIDIAGLDVRITKRTLRSSDTELTDELQSDDILFVDSSHILQEGFDLDIILNRILPRLAPGVVVHFHDIFLPYPYPSHWADYRFNEQGALVGWLLSGRFAPIFASHYAWRDMKAELQAICPRFPLDTPSNGGSLWLRRR
jgi:predicted O-methyltransferase YrrM